MKKRVLGWGALATVAVCGAWFGFRALLPILYPLEIDGIYLDEPIEIEEFQLTDHRGRVFDRERCSSTWSFLYFGYTHCPDACPLTLAHLARVEKLLSDQGLGENTAYWFVSVDPRRDDLDRLAEYTAYFSPNFGGATGAQDQIETLTLQLGAFYSVPEAPENPREYLVSHPGYVYLINPDMELQAVFDSPLDPERVSADFIRIRQRYARLH